jgi:hypothetical protein
VTRWGSWGQCRTLTASSTVLVVGVRPRSAADAIEATCTAAAPLLQLLCRSICDVRPFSRLCPSATKNCRLDVRHRTSVTPHRQVPARQPEGPSAPSVHQPACTARSGVQNLVRARRRQAWNR